MKHLSALIALLVISIAANAQSGSLTVSVSSDTFDDESFKIRLLKGDSVAGFETTDESGDCTFHVLAPGTYTLEATHPNCFTNVVPGIKIAADSITTLHLMMNNIKEAYTAIQPVCKPITQYLSCAFLMMPAVDGFNTGETGSSSYRFMLHAAILSQGKRAQAGFTHGITLGRDNFSDAARLKPEGVTGSERYISMNWDIGLVTRLSITGANRTDNKKLFIEAGGMYGIPVYYRHIASHDRTRVVTSRIHNFGEAYLFSRIGWSWFTLRAQYTPTNYLKTSYPQPSRMLYGIDLILPMD